MREMEQVFAFISHLQITELSNKERNTKGDFPSVPPTFLSVER